MLLWWAKRDFCMRAAQTTIFIIFIISPAYASWRVTSLLVLFCHVQNSLSCSLHCCNYIFALVMCTYRNISGWSDINTKICEQCGMDVTEWLWIGIGMCWCSRASTRGGKTTCTWLSTYNQQVDTVNAGIRCRSQKMKQDTEVTMKELEILQTKICAIWIRPILFSEEIIVQMELSWCASMMYELYLPSVCNLLFVYALLTPMPNHNVGELSNFKKIPTHTQDHDDA